MRSESLIREDGFEWLNVHSAFCWSDLSKDLMRELVEYDPIYKTQLLHLLLMDFHGYSIHASVFYQNMYNYIKLGIAETKELIHYAERVYIMYREQYELEMSSRQVYKITDGTGRVLDSWIA